MKPRLQRPAPHWIIGMLVAFAGVAVARLLAPLWADPARSALNLSGELLGLAGLGIIAWGVRRRIGAASATPHNTT